MNRWPAEAGRDKEKDSPLKTPRGNTALQKHGFEFSETHFRFLTSRTKRLQICIVLYLATQFVIIYYNSNRKLSKCFLAYLHMLINGVGIINKVR